MTSSANPAVDALLVRRPGMQTTVQDLGRPGYGRYGVPLSGAMDTLSLRLGNLLLDNAPDAAALEMTLVGPELEALAPTICAYVGADMRLSVGGRRVEPGRAFAVAEGEALRFSASRDGARAYLCVQGGLDVPAILGSRSTGVTARLGGVEGRALAAGDVLRALTSASPSASLPGRKLKPCWLHRYSHEWVLRITEGPEFVTCGEAVEDLVASAWKVDERSNRVGVRLRGPSLRAHAPGFETEGVPLGAIQIPPDGVPILLLADRQVTGGYPMPAVLASVDLPRAGQFRPGDMVRFERVAAAKAVELLRDRETRIAQGVYESAPKLPVDSMNELVRTLEASRVEEFRLERGGVSFRWKRNL